MSSLGTSLSVLLVACLQVHTLESQLAAACDRGEAAERQQQAAATAATLALSRAQHELQEARSAQFVAEEAHKTADAAAKLLAQKVTGVLCLLAAQLASVMPWRDLYALHGLHGRLLVGRHVDFEMFELCLAQGCWAHEYGFYCVFALAEVQREAAQQQGVADAAKLELRNQVASLMRDQQFQKQQAQVLAAFIPAGVWGMHVFDQHLHVLNTLS
jgi:hypothetical protein